MLTFEVRERVATRPEYLFLIERLSGIRQTKTEICSNIKDWKKLRKREMNENKFNN